MIYIIGIFVALALGSVVLYLHGLETGKIRKRDVILVLFYSMLSWVAVIYNLASLVIFFVLYKVDKSYLNKIIWRDE